MILDSLLQFTAATVGDLPTTGTQNSTNVIDLGVVSGIPSAANGGGGRDIGVGQTPSLKLLVQVLTTFTGGTSLQITIQGAIDDLTGAPSTFTNYWLSPAYTDASLIAGRRIYDMDMPRPPGGVAIPRYLRMGYITVGTHSAGAIQAFIVLDRDDQPYSSTGNQIQGGYQAGINVAN